jgi:hypothetical protein
MMSGRSQPAFAPTDASTATPGVASAFMTMTE